MKKPRENIARRAVEILEILTPQKSMTKIALMKRMKIDAVTFAAALSLLRQTHGVYTIGQGLKTAYELTREMSCTHPESAIVQDNEGTAFCGICADQARMIQHYNGTSV